MKKRLVLWGENDKQEKRLLALALNEKDNAVDLYSFPLEIATEEFANKMMNQWRNKEEVPFPEGYQHQVRELKLTDHLLPNDLRVERTDLISRAKTEWNFIVMSTKMREVYEGELEELHERIDRLEKFDPSLWEEMKTFWNKVQTQIRDKNLFGEHATVLRKGTNQAFGKMKDLRKKMDEEFKARSKEVKTKYQKEVDDIKKAVEKGLGLKPLFEDLKRIQSRFRKASLTRNDRDVIWQQIDSLFKEIKSKRFGDKKAKGGRAIDRLERRYEGLQRAITKMEKSIKRDQNDLDFETKRIKKTDGQLEQQIRQAKLKMIEERVRSKQDKLDDMLKTRSQLESKMEREMEKEKQKKLEEEKAKAKKEAEAKIKAQMQEQQQALSEEERNKLEKAASQMQQAKGKGKKSDPSSTMKNKGQKNVHLAVQDIAAATNLKIEQGEEE